MDGEACALIKLEDSMQSLQNYRLHDFRVTCETRLATLGFNQDVRDAVLGHAKQGLQRTYNKYDYHDEKKAALESYAVHLARIIPSNPAAKLFLAIAKLFDRFYTAKNCRSVVDRAKNRSRGPDGLAKLRERRRRAAEKYRTKNARS
jgi:hypothetical protein